jgi:hypothetical protein
MKHEMKPVHHSLALAAQLVGKNEKKTFSQPQNSLN